MDENKAKDIIAAALKKSHKDGVGYDILSFGFNLFAALGEHVGELECYIADNNIDGNLFIANIVAETLPLLYEVDGDCITPIVRA